MEAMPADGATVQPILYRLALEQTREYALFLLDTRGHILSCNVGVQALQGYLPDEIIGRHFSVFYTQEALEKAWPAYELKSARQEGRFEDEGWRVRKDGS